MTQVVIFHIDLTLTVAMVTENGRKNRLNIENVILRQNWQFLQTLFLKIIYQHS